MPNFLDQHRQQDENDTQVLARLIQEGVSLYHADLTDADLYHADLRHADLRHADLRHADLRHADLTSADLASADLTAADLTDADLTNANLASADLRHADLRHANLTDADLTAANLTDADLTAADLTAAITTGAKLPYPINITSFNGDVSPFSNGDGTWTYCVGCYTTTDTAEFVAVCVEKRGTKNTIAILLRTASFMVGTPQHAELLAAIVQLSNDIAQENNQ